MRWLEKHALRFEDSMSFGNPSRNLARLLV